MLRWFQATNPQLHFDQFIRFCIAVVTNRPRENRTSVSIRPLSCFACNLLRFLAVLDARVGHTMDGVLLRFCTAQSFFVVSQVGLLGIFQKYSFPPGIWTFDLRTLRHLDSHVLVTKGFAGGSAGRKSLGKSRGNYQGIPDMKSSRSWWSSSMLYSERKHNSQWTLLDPPLIREIHV